MSECVLKMLACRGLRVGPSKGQILSWLTPGLLFATLGWAPRVTFELVFRYFEFFGYSDLL